VAAVYVTPDSFNPRHEFCFREDVLDDLTDHKRQWRHPSDRWQTDDEELHAVIRECYHEAVEHWRRIGCVIEGDRRKGFRFVRWIAIPGLRLPKTRQCEPRHKQLTMEVGR
jgi:hypothetical protein